MKFRVDHGLICLVFTSVIRRIRGYMTFTGEESITGNQRFNRWTTVLSILMFMLILLDIASDHSDGVHWQHLILELLILSLSLAGIVYFSRLYFLSMQSKISSLKNDLAVASQNALQWREANRELVSGLAKQIYKQFDSWQLTRAEAEVGILILKGLSLSEIAELRQTSERTIRDQARAIYRKSGLNGRTELSAFFLEDLLISREDGST
ncbi:MAG: hypothetical protein PHH11_00405 [Methylomonas sp.]|nr:hypothetical protein [Methylomonas sp.]